MEFIKKFFFQKFLIFKKNNQDFLKFIYKNFNI